MSNRINGVAAFAVVVAGVLVVGCGDACPSPRQWYMGVCVAPCPPGGCPDTGITDDAASPDGASLGPDGGGGGDVVAVDSTPDVPGRDVVTCDASTQCFPDNDRDGFPVPTGVLTACACPAGFIEVRRDMRWDCADSERDAYPGQEMYFDHSYCLVRAPDGRCATESWDYDCNGTSEQMDRSSNRGTCAPSAGDPCGIGGWTAATPACGQRAEWLSCGFVIPTGCTTERRVETQNCR